MKVIDHLIEFHVESLVTCLSQKVSQAIVFAFFSFAESTFFRSAPIARGMKRPAADNSQQASV